MSISALLSISFADPFAEASSAPNSQALPLQSRIASIANSIFNAVKSCGSFIGGIFIGAWNVVSNTASTLTAKVTSVFKRKAPQSAVAAAREAAATRIQSVYRGYNLRQKVNAAAAAAEAAATRIQSVYRGYKVRQKVKAEATAAEAQILQSFETMFASWMLKQDQQAPNKLFS